MMRAPARARERAHLAHIGDRHAKFGVPARRAHVLVVATPRARVDAHEDVPAREQLRPACEHEAVVDRHAHAFCQRPGILGAGGKIGRVENACALDGGEKFAARA